MSPPLINIGGRVSGGAENAGREIDVPPCVWPSASKSLLEDILYSAVERLQ